VGVMSVSVVSRLLWIVQTHIPNYNLPHPWWCCHLHQCHWQHTENIIGNYSHWPISTQVILQIKHSHIVHGKKWRRTSLPPAPVHACAPLRRVCSWPCRNLCSWGCLYCHRSCPSVCQGSMSHASHDSQSHITAYSLSMTSLTNQCSVSISQLFTWLSHPLLYISHLLSHLLSHLTFSVVYKESMYSSIPQLQSLRISTIIGSCLSHYGSPLPSCF
jgi:hypothetical protein